MKIFRMLFSLLLLLCLCSCAQAQSTLYQLGDTMDDFTVTTYDGKTITLSEVLKGKEAVLVNIWASWCGPCKMEFPFFQEVYEQYADRVEIIALSSEPTDTDDVLSTFTGNLGLTFPVSRDTVNMSSRLSKGSIPITVMVDRFGTICFRQDGAFQDSASLIRLFEAFLGDGYTQSTLLDGIPPQKPNVTPSTADELAAALNVEGGALAFANGSGIYDWPMLAGEKDGRSVVISANKGVDDSASRVLTSISGQTGDAVAVTFKLSSAAGFDLMQLSVNGQVVKSFGGEEDWMTYAWELPADGEYAVTLSYSNSAYTSSGEDTLWVDSIAHLTGEAARAALDANPSYPTAEQASITVENAGAKQVVITDPTGVMGYYYGSHFYLVPDESVSFGIQLSPDYDPETTLVVSNYDNVIHVLADCLVDGRYVVSAGVNSTDTTGYCDTCLFVYPSANESATLKLAYCKDAANLEMLLNILTKDASGVVQGTWAYAESEPSVAAAPASQESTYVVKYIDQHGDPVPGVMCQVCDESTCQVFVSDANGECRFTLAPYAWEIHTLQLPEGYQGDTQTVTLAPVEGGEMVFTLTKN